MEAYLYKPLKEKKVKCTLCSHRCIIKDGKRGICGVRENRDGILESLVYGRLIAKHIDPIEKKPLFHFLPGSISYSIATVGCNFKCLFCQNADISQMASDHNGMIIGDYCSPKDVVDAAEKGKCKSIAYTYTEPTVFFEFAFDTAKLAHERGIRNVFITNGYMSSEALNMISPYLDAANVDLKAFTKSFYKEICGAKLEPVKETLKLMKKLGIFVEVTTLLIPGLNDGAEELKELALFIAGSLGTETPWHVSAFYPTYRLTDRPPTPVESLVMAREIGIKAGLRYVYTGNLPGDNGENTFCYSCGKLLINRLGFSIIKNVLEKGRCPYCGAQIDGICL
ncbi:MAG: AmmeMemoRadiSam system radical SAM enzyme [Desulfobacterales bacterium]|uniref:AmmeMemoRadiSam system radical SAM enzyme n=1 Tax=Candidatus Desulfaltia bathyphila TaxID=2841697 RepID=A0A8J6T8Z0_9BACT|nr:AmmeMemoRadiSam system radical SAM enzyme [Candidatus Desulfaltia bathyphila]MBL7207819.1 AmmeMemoRadiSam system radical SAM enzyme [Desulfobacterales bacterium]